MSHTWTLVVGFLSSFSEKTMLGIALANPFETVGGWEDRTVVIYCKGQHTMGAHM